MISRREFFQVAAATAALVPGGGWPRAFAQQRLTQGDLLKFEAVGNVTLVQMTNRISADSAEFNYKTKLGTFHTAAGIATIKPQVQRPSTTGIAVPTATNQDTDVYFVGELV